MITAIVFVKADVARIPEVAEAIAAIDGISEVYSVTGQIDLIALVRVRNHEDVAAVVGEWTCPLAGATRHLALHDAVQQSRTSLVPFDDRRDLTTVHQPVR